MDIDLQTASVLTQKVLALGILLESIELFLTKDFFSATGPLGDASKKWPPLVFFRAVAALLLLLLSDSNPLDLLLTLAALLFTIGSSIWLIFKARGPLCGGSDSMLFQVQLGLLIAITGKIFPAHLSFFMSAGLGWIAAQSILSYLIAGASKIKHASWREGEALHVLLNVNGPYTVFAPARAFASNRDRCRPLAWTLMAFELCFIAVLLAPPALAVAILALGILFHVANALVLGLNRFLWAWISTYPAILYFALQ